MPERKALRLFFIPVLLFSSVVTAKAEDIGWRKHLFDFRVPALNFETQVPADAKAETVPMAEMEPGSIGRVKIIGKVTPGGGGQQVETTIVGYDLKSPPAAARLCKYEAEIAGYTPRLIDTASDLTEAKVFATQSENGEPKSAILSTCFAKGKNALAIHFIVNVTGEPKPERAKKALQDLDTYSAAFLKEFQFSDGKQANFGSDMQSVPLQIDERKIDLQISKDWDVPINDFHGPLPAELHLLRRSQNKDVGLIWLNVQKRAEKPDLEKTGTEIIRNYFVKQAPDVETPVLLDVSQNAAMSEKKLDNREFRFSAKNKKGEDIGVIDATAVWKDGQLIVVSQWSTWAETASRNDFFTRLPGMTAYDLVRSAVLGFAP